MLRMQSARAKTLCRETAGRERSWEDRPSDCSTGSPGGKSSGRVALLRRAGAGGMKQIHRAHRLSAVRPDETQFTTHFTTPARAKIRSNSRALLLRVVRSEGHGWSGRYRTL